jgi:hypothetical protein
MPQSATAVHHIPPATITHTTVALRGRLDSDVAVYHARTPDVRISLTLGTTLMGVYTCQAAQGLLEAFAAARAAMARVPREIPSPAMPPNEPIARTTLAVDWTRRPVYSVVAQSGANKLHSAVIHWVDLYCGPMTFQIRDQIGLRSAIDLFTTVHKTAIAVCLDGPEYTTDPTAHDYQFRG